MRNICLGNYDQGGYILFTNLLTVQSQKPERDIKPVLNMGNTDNGNLNESAIDTSGTPRAFPQVKKQARI